MSRMVRSVPGWMLLMAIAAGMACAETQVASDPAQPAASTPSRAPLARPAAPACNPLADRPGAGDAAVEDRSDGGDRLVRYSATPGDAPCETLDVVIRLRGEMLIGAPGEQVELIWSTERAFAEGAAMSLLVDSAVLALPSQRTRTGPRHELTAWAPPLALARYGSERRPTIMIADRRIELSERQVSHLRQFLGRVRLHHVPRPPGRGRPKRAPAQPIDDDPAAGQGWFCVEAAGDGRAVDRSSSCHRSAAQCEEARARMAAAGPVGECMRSPSASCFTWGAGAEGRACFYRPSQCARDLDRREDEGANTGGGECRPVP